MRLLSLQLSVADGRVLKNDRIRSADRVSRWRGSRSTPRSFALRGEGGDGRDHACEARGDGFRDSSPKRRFGRARRRNRRSSPDRALPVISIPLPSDSTIPPPLAMASGPKPKRTALVSAGAAAKGAFEAGAIAALTAAGIVFRSLVGTSSGALNAAFMAVATRSADERRNGTRSRKRSLSPSER